MKIEITEYQAKVLWTACNQAQGNGIEHMSRVLRSGMQIPESWTDELTTEYDALQDIKEQLGWDNHE